MVEKRNGIVRAADPLARGLGWLSIGLGITDIALGGSIARSIGLKGKKWLVRGYGAREVATGVGILASENPTPWIWARIAGDGLDLATIAPSMGRHGRKGVNAAIAFAMVAGVTALDVLCVLGLEQRERRRVTTRDYSDRSGFPKGAEAMRGAARDFVTPRDMRAPEALRPWTESRPQPHRVERSPAHSG